jgi:hypothetical protein
MSLSKLRAKQIIQEELRRALRTRRINENYMDEMGGDHMMEDDVYELDLGDEPMDEMYDMDEGAYEGEMHYEGTYEEGMYEEDMEEGQHDNDMGGQHDNDMGAGDDALMETVRRRLAAARRRR